MPSFLLPCVPLFPLLAAALLTGAKRRQTLGQLLLVLGTLLVLLLTAQTVFTASPIESLVFRLDALSGAIALTVALIGGIVLRFSLRQMADDQAREKFLLAMGAALTGVLVMLLASNLLLLYFGWFGSSYFLHQLLTHFRHREKALEAARQKFWVSRIGDAFLIAGMGVLWFSFGTLEFQTLFAKLADPELTPDAQVLTAAALLFAGGALTKSAQIPFHGWLPNTMETPTPVSALMHAGILNAGGYLMLRLHPLLEAAPLSLTLLAVVGGMSALVASCVMLTQTTVKRSLAYSTIAQMGFMLLQCGLGAYVSAVVHIVGHAFYKAYAFLSSPSTTDFAKLQRYFPPARAKNGVWGPFLALLSTSGLIFLCVWALGLAGLLTPARAGLLLILALALAQVLLSTPQRLLNLRLALSMVLLYALALTGARAFLRGVFAEGPSTGQVSPVVVLVAVGCFLLVFLFQNNLYWISRSELGKRLYVRALNKG